MSLTLTVTGNSSVISTEFFPPIELLSEYTCGLVSLHTYNSIPNIDKRNNSIQVADHFIEIPEGSYELSDVEAFIKKELAVREKETNDKTEISIKANNNTLKSELFCNKPVLFITDTSIAPLLGFNLGLLAPHVFHVSSLPVNIVKVNSIHISCNIITGSYLNDKLVNTLYEFSPNVAPGFRMIEVPRNVIYLPLNVRRITSLLLTITDQDGELINFREEKITIRLHLLPK